MNTEASVRNACFISEKLLRAATLPRHLRLRAADVQTEDGCGALSAPLFACMASELLAGELGALEAKRGPSTRYLVVIDVPEPALVRLPSVLELRRPEQRLHVTRDAGALRRLLVATLRDDPRLGVVDAYVLGGELVVLCGDLQTRSFPVARVPSLAALRAGDRERFEIDADGAYLYWPAGDLHLGVAQLLQAADPAYLADVYMERYSRDLTGPALRRMREERGLKQVDIAGLSERQVRRIEDGISRLRAASAQHFAAAFRIPLDAFLAELARRAGDLRTDS